MASAEIDAGTKKAPPRGPARSNRVGNGYYGSFRRRLRVVAIGLLLVNLALGLFARQQLQAIIEYAVDVYDTAFISTNYVHLAQMSFQRYVDERVRAVGTAEISKANELLDKVLDEMAVAAERAYSQRSRDEGLEIWGKIARLASVGTDAPELADQLSNIQQQMEQLAARNAAVGL